MLLSSKKYIVVADTEEKEELFKLKDGGNQSCWKSTTRSERLGEGLLQRNGNEIEKRERGREENPDWPGISE